MLGMAAVLSCSRIEEKEFVSDQGFASALAAKSVNTLKDAMPSSFLVKLEEQADIQELLGTKGISGIA